MGIDDEVNTIFEEERARLNLQNVDIKLKFQEVTINTTNAIEIRLRNLVKIFRAALTTTQAPYTKKLREGVYLVNIP